MYDLERFVMAQERDYNTALTELQAGRKTNHWIWYIFPQLETLGYSERAKYFGISCSDEAIAYMNHPILGPRYLKCIAALMKHRSLPVEDIMGGDVDAKKLTAIIHEAPVLARGAMFEGPLLLDAHR
jgi:uncharacterized protein (DUF1810 family)